MPDCCVCEQNDSSAHLRAFQYFLITMSCRFNGVLVDQFFMADFSVNTSPRLFRQNLCVYICRRGTAVHQHSLCM